MPTRRTKGEQTVTRRPKKPQKVKLLEHAMWDLTKLYNILVQEENDKRELMDQVLGGLHELSRK